MKIEGNRKTYALAGLDTSTKLMWANMGLGNYGVKNSISNQCRIQHDNSDNNSNNNNNNSAYVCLYIGWAMAKRAFTLASDKIAFFIVTRYKYKYKCNNKI